MRKQLMKCRHGRTWERGCRDCQPPPVTHTGHAISAGRVTRASLSVKRKHDGKPLPIHLQCHPVHLTRTSHNPSCFTYDNYAGLAIKLQQDHGLMWFARGNGLQAYKRYSIVNQAGNCLGSVDDLVYAKAWRSAAFHNGLWVDIVEC